MRKQLTLLFAFVIAAAAFAAAANTTAPKSTLDNLQAAFNGESNAHARYVEFAKKADKEGYAQVASLFARQPGQKRSTPIITQRSSRRWAALHR
jgi:ABC-type transporter MlaC component